MRSFSISSVCSLSLLFDYFLFRLLSLASARFLSLPIVLLFSSLSHLFVLPIFQSLFFRSLSFTSRSISLFFVRYLFFLIRLLSLPFIVSFLRWLFFSTVRFLLAHFRFLCPIRCVSFPLVLCRPFVFSLCCLVFLFLPFASSLSCSLSIFSVRSLYSSKRSLSLPRLTCPCPNLT